MQCPKKIEGPEMQLPGIVIWMFDMPVEWEKDNNVVASFAPSNKSPEATSDNACILKTNNPNRKTIASTRSDLIIRTPQKLIENLETLQLKQIIILN